MTVSLNLTETQIVTALGNFLVAVLPSGVQVMRGQGNRAAEPGSPDFVIMTPMGRTRLATNIVSTNDPYPAAGTRADLQKTQVTVQVDIHGPNAADNLQIVTTLWRSEVGAELLASSGYAVSPLFASEPHQMPFLNGEQQIETRWTVDLVMQADQVVTSPQEFADALSAGIFEVDATYPP